ncbi:hypothetical protein FACS1894151_02250 [Spirochaetia bacterium]|nr:hypothetical protein FACS1894151_02250 [Spirochaetia bacterium]
MDMGGGDYRVFPVDMWEGGMEIYLMIVELAGMVKLSEQTIRRYVLNRTIPYQKI